MKVTFRTLNVLKVTFMARPVLALSKAGYPTNRRPITTRSGEPKGRKPSTTRVNPAIRAIYAHGAFW
jgi:hypothetical protein